MTTYRAASGETQLPAPPQAPLPEDFPAVASIEPPRLPAAHGAGLAVGIMLIVALAVGIEWLSGDRIETAPVLFIAVIAAAWWLERGVGLFIAAVAGALWAAVALGAAQTPATVVSAVALVGSLVGIALAVSAV
ncbi:MAG: hypothetical protein M3Z65_05490, partial [Chloroflexota bacterium]|nr:hypothetical protein [Chloroflexota bacterium]